jgi:hypothetical protein
MPYYKKEITSLLAGVHNCVLTLAQQKLELLLFSVSLVFFVVSLVLLGVGTVCMDSVLKYCAILRFSFLQEC